MLSRGLLITRYVYINKSRDSYQQDILHIAKKVVIYPQIEIFVTAIYS
ncbi:MAG: hypothetical protein H6Q69_1135 [Firmicutes bacterium]|nr:hypothetical protein [Bacillota bacterium]